MPKPKKKFAALAPGLCPHKTNRSSVGSEKVLRRQYKEVEVHTQMGICCLHQQEFWGVYGENRYKVYPASGKNKKQNKNYFKHFYFTQRRQNSLQQQKCL